MKVLLKNGRNSQNSPTHKLGRFDSYQNAECRFLIQYIFKDEYLADHISTTNPELFPQKWVCINYIYITNFKNDNFVIKNQDW